MKKGKIIAGLIGAAAAIAAVCSISIFAGAEETSGYWKYIEKNDGTVYISGYTGFADKLSIPTRINGKTVSGIEDFAFQYSNNFNTIVIPSTVEYIGFRAFDSSSVTSISIPSTVTEMNSYVFNNCDKLKTVTVNAESISHNVFSNCDNLTSVTLGANVKYLSDEVFYNDSALSKVTIQGDLLKIGGDAFSYCSSLKSIDLGKKINSIGWNAFSHSGLKTITVPSTITQMSYAFKNCPALTSATVNADFIGEYAFSDCDNLTTVTINSETIGYRAFYSCDRLATVTMGAAVKYILDDAFYDNEVLSKVTVKGDLLRIGEYSFGYCYSLTSINLGKRLYTISGGAFAHTGLKSVNVPGTTTKIGNFAFSNCTDLTSVYLGYNCLKTSDSDVFGKSYNVHIYCYPGSDALKYAKEYGIPYTLRKAVPSTSLKLNKTSVVLEVGERLMLNTTLSPSNSNDGVTWESGDLFLLECYSGVLYAKRTGVVAVRAKTTSGKTAICNVTIIEKKPDDVSGVKLTARGSSALAVKWTPTNTADGYIIEKYANGKWSRVAKITNRLTSSYTVRGLKPSTKYSIRVKSYKMIGSLAAYSKYVTGAWTTNPSDVAGLKLKGRASDALRLSWSKNTSADGYILEQKSGSSWKRISKLTKNTITEYRISGLKAGTAYNFRIRSYNMVGKTPLYSGYKSISARTDPTAVGGLYLKGSAKDAVRLAWNKNTSADGYIIERKSGSDWIRVKKITKNSTSEYRISGLKSKTSYTFRVRTYKMSGKTPLYGAAKTITVRTK